MLILLAGNIAVSSDDFLFVVAAETADKTEEEKIEDENKDKEEEKKAKEESKNIQNQISYYIKVNRSANTVTVYTQDENGNYTIPVRSMVCSTGYASPTGGVYSISKIGTWHTLFGGVYGQYCTQITGNILFHSVPYLRRGDNASLEYWAYDRLGTTASAGCIRLTTADAQWIYYNCSNGTKVEFYSSQTPGPLGKPSATKISSAGSPYMNWDPTDPNPNNPWKTNPPNLTSETEETTKQEPEEKKSEQQQSSSVTVTSIENTTKQDNNTSNNSTNSNLNNTTNSNNKTNTNTNANINTNTNNTNVNTNSSGKNNTSTNVNTNTNTNNSNNVNTNTNKSNNTITNSNTNIITP